MTRDDERAALLRAVLDEPAQDLPRLVYADWLEEYGGEADRARAEFVRVQVELAKCPRNDSNHCSYCGVYGEQPHWEGCRAGRLLAREDALLHTMIPNNDLGGYPGATIARHYWGPRLPGNASTWTFRRGFVAEVMAPLALLLDHGREVLRAHPVERVVATDRRPLLLYRNGGARPGWRKDDGGWASVADEDLCLLPPPVFALVQASSQSARSLSAAFPTEAAALDALSDALLALLRPARLTGRARGG